MAHTEAGFKRQRKLEERTVREEHALKILSQHNQKKKQVLKIRTKRKSPEEIVNLLPKEVNKHWMAFGIREPEQWVSKSYNVERQVKDFARWLFCKYDVPPFMFELFDLRKRNTTRIINHKEFDQFMSWFITIGQGYSFAKAVKELFTKKEAHIFLNAPKDQTIVQNIWWTKCVSRNIPNNFTNFVVQRFGSRSGARAWAYKDHFWITFLDFVKRNENELNVATLQEIIDFLPAQRRRNGDFSLKGRTLNSLIQLSNEWHREQQATKHGRYQQWDGLPIEDWGYTNKREGIKWVIKQLHNSKELYMEGRRMRHCVYGYVSACVSGRSGIFTMESSDKFNQSCKHLTLEVSSGGKQIVQARGRLNRKPNSAEANVVYKWANEKHLTISAWTLR